MKALVISPEKNLILEEAPEPVPEAGHVLIRIKASGVNRADLLQVVGKYPPPAGWPAWPGLECSGIIERAPDGSIWHPGDKVCALLGGGGYAEYVSVPEGMVLPMPGNLDFVKAAALPEVYTTAFLNLGLLAKIQPGEKLFVQAGASGLGIAAIQLAKHVFQAKVITTVGSDDKAEVVQALGADEVINRRRENVPERLLAFQPDVALDCAGGEILADCLRAMRPGGRWILVATLGGETANVPLRLVLKQHLSLIGSTLRSRSDAEKAQILAKLQQQVWPAIEANIFQPIVYQKFPATDANAAHDILKHQQNAGKVILTWEEA